MAVTHPWLAGILALVVIALAVTAWRLPLAQHHRIDNHALPVAFVERLRALPRFRARVRQQLRWRTIEAVALGVAVLGALGLAAGPVAAQSSATRNHNRDIVLCLDVSGSMAAVDREVIDAYLELARNLRGERIGFMLFDASAVTVFPLTDDADYITQHLQATRDQLDGRELPGTKLGAGTSLIGDGLVSCLQRFDRIHEDRSRTVVLATDNMVAGQQLFTVDQAAGQARDLGVLVFGVVPSDNPARTTADLTRDLRSTGGDVLLLTGTNTDQIEKSVQEQERSALDGQHKTALTDLSWPPALVCLLGVAIASLARIGRPS